MNIFYQERLALYLKSKGLENLNPAGKIPPGILYNFLETMPRIHHICLKGNNSQNLVYESYEFIPVINRMALAAHAKRVIIWAYAFLSNHLHILVQPSEDESQLSKFKQHFRMSLSHYYHQHNNSEGMVGCRKFQGRTLPLSRDFEEIKDITSYILRNPIRHGLLKNNPFDYQWSSIHSYFKKSLLQNPPSPETQPPQKTGITILDYQCDFSEIHEIIPASAPLPDKWKMNASGLILPEFHIASEAVEQLYGTAERFVEEMFIPGRTEIFYREKELDEQKARDAKRPFRRMQENRLRSEQILDLQASEYIYDRIGNTKIPTLPLDEKIRIAKAVKGSFPQITLVQLSRILTIPRSSLYRLWDKY